MQRGDRALIFEALQARFTTARRLPPDVLGGWRSGDHALDRMARIIAAELAADAKARPEPPYHNRHHVAEAVTSMALLCESAQACGLIDRELAELGQLAMLGHDLGHDGSLAVPGLLEKRSAERVASLATKLPAASLSVLRRVILATDPNAVVDNLACANITGADPLDVLCALANEADVLASLLPNLGWVLSELLRQEWKLQDADRAANAVSFAGRNTFLTVYARPTVAGVALGLDRLVALQLDAFAPEGPGAFDAMPRADAMAQYAARIISPR